MSFAEVLFMDFHVAQQAYEATLDQGDPSWHALTSAQRQRWVRFLRFGTEFTRCALAERAKRTANLRFGHKLRGLLKLVEQELEDNPPFDGEKRP